MKKFDSELKECRICGSKNISLYHRDFQNVNIFICNDCKVQFMNPQYTDQYLADYYSGYTKEEPEWDEPLSYGHNYYLSLIEKYSPKKGTLLDVGCGKGHLLHQAKKRGWQPQGYDVDCNSVNYFSEKFKIQIFCGDFNKLFWQHNSYNAVTLHHVFEHLKDPVSYLKTISSILVQNGILFLVLPNIKGLSSRIKFKLEKWGLRKKNVGKYYDTSHHLFYYEPKTLSRLLTRFGYKILFIRSGHKVRPGQSQLVRYFLRNVSERMPWKSTFLIIAVKDKSIQA